MNEYTCSSPTPAPPPPLHASAERVLGRLVEESNASELRSVSAGDLLMERARLLELTFDTGRSAGDACRLLTARDGVVAANLPRTSDWELVPAWLEHDAVPERGWTDLAARVRSHSAEVLRDRARLLGLAVAMADPPATAAPVRYRVEGAPLAAAAAARRRGRRRPRVLDLSALWAGPLCAHLLHLCGAEVIKVEALDRPDGARFGNAGFYALLNQGKRSVALDFATAAGRRALTALIDHADIVIESSRPRALQQLGIDAEAIVRARTDLTWVSITGYGRPEPNASWVAFGDNAGVAAGLSRIMESATGRLEFAGDAIADPLTGLAAALAAWRSWQSGGARLVSLALADVAAAGLAEEIELEGETAVIRSFGAWWTSVQGRRLPRSAARPVTGAVAALGEHNRAIFEGFGIPC